MSFWVDVASENRTVLFGMSHLFYIGSVVVITFLFLWKLKEVKERLSLVRKLMIIVSFIQVFVLYLWSGLELGFSLEAGLPIHLCRMSSFLGLYFLITEDKRVFHALYYMSAFAIVAIFYPVNVHPIYTHVIGWSYQISHIMIVLVWILGVFVYGYRPTYTIMWKAMIVFLFILLIVWRFNYLVGDGEYLYLRGDVNRPFLKELHDVLWIGVMMIISGGLMFIMTLPVVRGDKHVFSE